MIRPSLPNGDAPKPTAGSNSVQHPGPVGVGQPVLNDRSDVGGVAIERLQDGKRTAQGEGVRVRVVADEEEARANVTLRSEWIEANRVLVGRVVESAPPDGKRTA